MTGGLRERKKAATRAALRTAAIRLAREQGPAAVTVEAVCALADVSPRTFFNYFEAKDDAFFGADPEVLAAIASAIAGSDAPGAWEALVPVLRGVLADTTGSAIWHDQLLLLREHPELLPRAHAGARAFEQAVAEGIARRTGRTPADPWVATAAAVGVAVLRVALGRWLDSPEGADPGALFDESAALAGAGLATAPATAAAPTPTRDEVSPR